MVTENGITFDLKSEKFGTEGLSMFYRLKDKQKDSEESLDSYMVTLVESNWNDILMEFWRLYHLMRSLSLA